jgi:hypothetical protein
MFQHNQVARSKHIVCFWHEQIVGIQNIVARSKHIVPAFLNIADLWNLFVLMLTE